ncbi:hypothetical protein GCM10009609_54220 [Pseudonocardia aurantiaca]|uniref:histidine kinase n=1 Tax=Pseudonocardia aurantiaca TaxID=75290 RepID=A0ABW4FH82_9PSEU
MVDQQLAPALAEGVLVVEPGLREAVRFRHDRTREVILGGLDPLRRRALQLAMARRLAGVPELYAVAAEQFLPVIDAVADAAERHLVVGLLRRAADQAALVGDHALLDALLVAALRLIEPGETTTLIEVHTGRHAALYGLGRLEEADEEYRTIDRLCPTAMQRADATCVQVSSLTHRKRFTEAIDLGIESLRECDITVPAADQLGQELDHQYGYLYRWLDTDTADELARPEITDRRLLAAARLIDAILPTAYFAADHASHTWLSLEALRIWIEHGPGRTLFGPAGTAAFAAVAQRCDYRAGYRAFRRLLEVGEARGYEPETSRAHYAFAVISGWYEPIENCVDAILRAREGLIAGGDLANAGYTYLTIDWYLQDCAPTLDHLDDQVEAGVAFVRRTGSEQTGQALDGHRWLAGALRGESFAAAGDAVPTDRYADNPLALFQAHLNQAIAAAVFGDPVDLTKHTAAVMPLLPAVLGIYATAVARLLCGLALAEQARASDGDERVALLSELDETTRWLAARAADAPDNFRHLLRWLEAERAWAVGDVRAAELAFDAARREVAGRARPWHRALITERTACFHLARGLEHTGHELLAQARQAYLAWGASAKVDQLDWAYPTLRPHSEATVGPGGNRPADPHQRGTVTTGTLDLLGILAASQALSSETTIERLHTRVVQVLRAMTGATNVHLLLWDDDGHDWLLPAPGGDGGAAQIGGTGHENAVPMSVLRYAQRTGEPLVVADATGDDRFARDPYFTDLDRCSLLALPILSRGALRAVLLLENRLIRGAFTTGRLDAIQLIAGQLAVSLDNAQLYAEYRRIADEQAALRRVATLVARAAPPEEVFAAVTAEAARQLPADHANLLRYEPDGAVTFVAARDAPIIGTRARLGGRNIATLVFETGQPARLDDYADASGATADLGQEWGFRAAVGAPIRVAGRLWGVMIAGSRREESLPPDTEERLAGFTELVATAIANAETQAQLTASRARIVAAADQARRRIERDLHDGTQQRLVFLALQLRAAQTAVPPEACDLEAQLDDLAAEATSALDELRELARGIHPSILAEGGLRPALKTLARRSAVPAELDVRVDGRLPEQIEVATYFVVSEALTNAAKHAHASVVHVEVDTGQGGDGVLQVRVRDDGRGGASFAHGSGLVGLKDRVEALGGRFGVQSVPGAGTTVQAELPLRAVCG